VQQLVDNRYQLLKPLGSGGMADVYLAHDDILDRDVALKVMSTRYASDEEFVERFKREAQSAAALSHPNIVSIFDRGESEDGTYYIAMEYLPGGTLKDRILKRGALPAHTAAAVALQIAEALRAAHDRDVIHRDIKPHNILVTGSGDVKVTDFGIARAASSSTMTRTGHILGTAHYISPEQAMGEHVGPASDLYSLGVVLYEMLTGELPFDADTPIGIAMKHVNGHVRPPQDLNPSVPDGINAITLRLLAKNPEDRYGSDAELIDDLERFCAGLDPSGATTEVMTRAMPAATARMGPPPPPQGSDQGKKRRRRAVPLLLALLGLLVWGSLAWAGAWVGYGLLQDRQFGQNVPRIGVPNLVGMNLDEARDKVGDDFDIQVSESVDGEKPVDTITGQDPSTGKAEKGSEISVTVVGKRVASVPSVVGSERAAAEQKLRDAGFEVEVDEQASSFGDEGKVTGQNPEGGARPGVGTSVAITVGTGPSSVGVPQLYGNTPAQARSILGEANLKLGDKSSEYNGDVAEGSIFFQDPAEGQRVVPGTAVDVTVSLGVQQVEVPEVYGLSVADARATLSGVGLNSTTFEVEGDETAGTALSTDPSVGAMVDPGSTVTLYYSAGPPPVTTSSPAASSSPAATAPPKTQTRPENQAQPQDQAQPKPQAQPEVTPKPQAQPEVTPKPQAQPNQGAQGGGTGNAKPSKATKPPGGSQDSGSGGGGNGGSSAGNSGSGGGGNVGGGSGRTGGGTRVQASKASGSGTGK
jgi:beta-lactam-binding protein with PASTA domain